MNDMFERMLIGALLGDQDAMFYIIEQYMSRINRRSVIDNVLDEDCRQYIVMRLLKEIPKFEKIYRQLSDFDF